MNGKEVENKYVITKTSFKRELENVHLIMNLMKTTSLAMNMKMKHPESLLLIL